MPEGIENMELAIQMTVESLYMAGLWAQESHQLQREMESQVQTSLNSAWSSNWEALGLPVQWVDEMVVEEPDERSSSRGSHGDPDSLLVSVFIFNPFFNHFYRPTRPTVPTLSLCLPMLPYTISTISMFFPMTRTPTLLSLSLSS